MLKTVYTILLFAFMTTWSIAQINITSKTSNEIRARIDPIDFLDLDYLEKQGYAKSPGSEGDELIYSKKGDDPFNGILGFELLNIEKNKSFLQYFNDPKNQESFKALNSCNQLKGVRIYYRIKEQGQGDNKIFEIEACFFIGANTIGFFTMNKTMQGAMASMEETCNIVKIKS